MINLNGATTDCFNCNIGVRQGENLSPFLFSLYMYINELEQVLLDTNIVGLESVIGLSEDELCVYLKLFILLYADDTVVMAGTYIHICKML
jgi:hypothetical protein